MSCADNRRSALRRLICRSRGAPAAVVAWVLICLSYGLNGCDRMGGARYDQLMKNADSKSAQGDFARAINLYEAALDDSPRCAEVHYKLALIYDDKLNDPVSALHHFKRCLELSPNGPHAIEVKNSLKHDEITALTALSGDSVIPRSEVARLENENLNLRKQLELRTGPARIDPERSQANNASSKKIGTKQADRTYVVQSGDTLVSISRKFYQSPKHWKQILEANKGSIRNPKNLTIGQTLVIP